MTKIVLTTEAISRTAQYSEMIPKEFISPTPAGTKNNPMFWVRTVERRFTFSGFTFLNARAKNNSNYATRYETVDKVADKLSREIEEENVKCFC